MAAAGSWLAVDWGTSRLRAWAMEGERVRDTYAGDEGMATLARDAFAPALARVAASLALPDGAPVVACGMLGARQGWVEAPYRAVPCLPLAPPFARPPGAARPVHVIPGLRQDAPPDVMRGEETQIAGFVARNPGWDGVLCLPGTHTKWAEISAGEVVSFRTHMTGEIFALLSGQSILRHSVAATGWDDAAFDAGVGDGLSHPERLAQSAFGLRAADLLRGGDGAAARARLSGLLIGAELAAARPYWLGQRLAILGSETQSALYARALGAQGATAEVTDGAAMTRAGLVAARALLKEDTA